MTSRRAFIGAVTIVLSYPAAIAVQQLVDVTWHRYTFASRPTPHARHTYC